MGRCFTVSWDLLPDFEDSKDEALQGAGTDRATLIVAVEGWSVFNVGPCGGHCKYICLMAALLPWRVSFFFTPNRNPHM